MIETTLPELTTVQNQVSLLDTYGETFQKNIIKLIVEQPIFFSCVQDHLLPSHFTYKPSQILFELILGHRDTYKLVPDYDTLETLTRIRLGRSSYLRDLILNELVKLRTASTKGLDFVQEKTIEFCKTQVLRQGLEEAVRFLERAGNPNEKALDFTKLVDKFQNINRISVETIDSGIMQGWDELYRDGGARRNVVPSGLKFWDYLNNGGFAAGELHTIAAYTNIGKSTMVRHIGANMILAGKKILHITTEDSQNTVKASYHSRVSGIPKRQFVSRSQEAKKIWDRILAETGAYLHVKEFPMGRHTIDSVENYYLRLRDEGFKPDILVIDSPLDLIPKHWSDNERLNIAQTFQATKGLAQEYEFPCLATAQLNRGAAGKRDNGTDKVGEAIQIAQISHSMLTINRDDDDMEKGIAVLKSAKSRESKAGETWAVSWKGSIGKIVEFDLEVEKRIKELEAIEMQQSFEESRELQEDKQKEV